MKKLRGNANVGLTMFQTYRDMAYVKREVNKLAKQLRALEA